PPTQKAGSGFRWGAVALSLLYVAAFVFLVSVGEGPAFTAVLALSFAAAPAALILNQRSLNAALAEAQTGRAATESDAANLRRAMAAREDGVTAAAPGPPSGKPDRRLRGRNRPLG